MLFRSVWTEWDDECEYMLYTLSDDGILVLNIDGVGVYYQVDFDTSTFDQYIPSENVIASYVYDEIEMHFLGTYTGAGEYFVKYGGMMGYDKNEDGTVTYYYGYVTIMMTLDLEAGTITFVAMDETLLILPDGSLATPADEERRERYLNDMSSTWSNIKLSFTVTDEQHERFNELYDAILNAIYNEQLREAYSEFHELVEEIRMNGIDLPTNPGDSFVVITPSDDNKYEVSYGDINGGYAAIGGENGYTVVIDGVEYTYATITPAA